jgi:hypothetical protein
VALDLAGVTGGLAGDVITGGLAGIGEVGHPPIVSQTFLRIGRSRHLSENGF